MRKLVQFSATALVTLSLAGGVAFADSISNTGADSFNWIINKETNKVTITCDNEADFVNVNDQSANSGTVQVESNTNSGNATSGDASNINQVIVDMNIGCAPAKVTSVTPPAGGQGGGTKTPVTSTPAAKALPQTGSNSAVIAVGTATVAFGTLAAVSRFGASAYRKLF